MTALGKMVWKPAETLTEMSIVGAFQDATRVRGQTAHAARPLTSY